MHVEEDDHHSIDNSNLEEPTYPHLLHNDDICEVYKEYPNKGLLQFTCCHHPYRDLINEGRGNTINHMLVSGQDTARS